MFAPGNDGANSYGPSPNDKNHFTKFCLLFLFAVFLGVADASLNLYHESLTPRHDTFSIFGFGKYQ